MVATLLGKRVGPRARRLAFELHSPDLPVPADVADYARVKIEARLQKYGRRVMGVVAHVKDVNGSKRGVDKVCHLEALMAGLEPVNVEERHEDLRAVIDLAIDRLEEATGRHIERARTRPRNQGRKLVRHAKLTGP